MYLIDISKKKKQIFSIFSVIFIGVGYYLAVYQSFSYQSFNHNLGGIIILLGIFCLKIFWFRWRKKWSHIILTIIAIATIIFIYFQRENFIDQEVNQNGVIVKAQIIGFESNKNNLLSRRYRKYATFRYSFRDKIYIQRVECFDENECQLHQIFNIKISQKNPEIFKKIKE